MAAVYPAANGNFSTVANWMSGGVPYGMLPQSGDDVYSNNKTVTIDMDVNVLSLRNSSATGITAGGTFQIGSSRNITLTGIGVYCGFNNATGCIGIISAGITVNITTTAITSAAGNTCRAVVINAAATVNITSTTYCPDSGSGNNNDAIYISGAATVNHTGNITGGYGLSYGVFITTTGVTFNQTGSITSGSGGNGIQAGTNAVTITQTGGIITPTLNYPGIYAVSSSTTVITSGNHTNVNNTCAVCSQKLQIYNSGTSSMIFQTNISGTNKSLLSSAFGLSASDLRSGTVVGSIVGTLAVPPVASVAVGVPTDNTVGTAAILQSDIETYLSNALTAYGVSSLVLLDILSALSTYNVAKVSDLSGIDVSAALAAYGVAKVTDIPNIQQNLTSYDAVKNEDLDFLRKNENSESSGPSNHYQETP